MSASAWPTRAGVAPSPWPEASCLTLEHYLTRWLAHTKGRVRPRTWQAYESLIRCHAVPGLGHMGLTALHPLDLQGMYDALVAEGHLSAGTVLNLHLVLTQALGQAVRWQLLVANPAGAASPPRPRRPEPVVADAALVSRILAHTLGTTLELPVAIAVSTGMRRGEILGLRWADIDQELSVARVRRAVQVTPQGLEIAEPKTRRSRRAVALPGMLGPYLVRQRTDQERRRLDVEEWMDLDLVIDRGDGYYLHPDTLSSGWRNFCRRSRLPKLRFHDLRHAHATVMLAQGVHPKVVSERLGHASVGITLDTYSHVLPSMQEEAAQAFDDLFASDS